MILRLQVTTPHCFLYCVEKAISSRHIRKYLWFDWFELSQNFIDYSWLFVARK